MATQEDVKQAVIDHLLWDDRIMAAGIEVDMEEGIVRLKGYVPRISDRVAAEEDALEVPGVVAVENKLEVKPPEGYTVLTDEQIRKYLEDHLSSDYRIDPLKVDVHVYGGVVTLDGTVSSCWKRKIVEDYAYSKPGVVDVVNNLSVVPSLKQSDEQIANEIKKAFKRSVLLDGHDITVQVDNGLVTLTGTANSYAVVKAAKEIASYTPGVTEISNKIDLISSDRE